MIRLLSYNIHGCIGWKGTENPAAILEIIKEVNADVVALQEVHDEDQLDRSFLRALERLDYASVLYGPTMRKINGHYGNILMSRCPVRNSESIDISFPNREPRGAIRAVVVQNDIEYEITATHLGLNGKERYRQIQQLADHSPGWRPSARTVKITVGDFNDWLPWSRGHRMLREAFGYSTRLKTFPACFPVLNLDRIYLKPKQALFKVFTLQTPLAKTASDHLPLIAELRPPSPSD